MECFLVFFLRRFFVCFVFTRKRNMSPQTVIEVLLMAKHNPGHSLVTGHSLNIDNSLFLFFHLMF